MFLSFDQLVSSNLIVTFGLLGVFALLAIAYSIRLFLKGRAQSARVDKEGGSALLGKGVMEMGYWALQPIGRALVSMGVTANMVTWASLVCGLLAGICLGFGHYGFGGFFAMLAGFMDALDGMVARLSGTLGQGGEILDSSVDRYVESFFIAGLIVHYREIPALQILALLALIGAYMVSYSSAKAEIHKISPPRGSMRRGERAVYLTAGAILSPITIPIFEKVREFPIAIGHPMVFALGLVAVLSNASAIERLTFIAREISRREKADRAARAKILADASAGMASSPAEDPVKLR